MEGAYVCRCVCTGYYSCLTCGLIALTQWEAPEILHTQPPGTPDSSQTLFCLFGMFLVFASQFFFPSTLKLSSEMKTKSK